MTRASTLLPPLAMALLAGPARAATTVVSGFEHSPERSWLANYDPTLLSHQSFTELSYEDQDGGRSTLELSSSLRWSLALREGLALGFYAKLPYKWADTGSDHVSGIGDLELRTGVVGRLSPTFRYGLGLNAKFDTAASAALGDGAFILRPIVAGRWDVTPRVNLGFDVEYNFTPEDAGPDDASYLELKFPVVFKIAERWSAFVSYKPTWNFLSEDSQERIEVGGGYVFGQERDFALSLGLELPLSSQSLDWKIKSGFAWYF